MSDNNENSFGKLMVDLMLYHLERDEYVMCNFINDTIVKHTEESDDALD